MTAPAQGREAINYFFELSLFLFVTTGFVTVAATGKLDAPSVILVGGALALRVLAFLGLTRISLMPSTVTRLTVGYFFFYAIDYLFLSRSFVDATGHLVFFVMVVKLFSARVNRDFLYLGLLAFLEMLLAAILTIGTSFLGFFLVFLVFGIATFTSYEIRRAYERAAHPAEVSGGPILVGLSATSVLVSFGILLLGGLIFFVIPRFTTGYLSRFAPKAQHFAGFSDNVTLGEIGDIKKSATVVMRVRFRKEPPQLRQLRWRGVALTLFDGRRWFNATPGTRVLSGAGGMGTASVATSHPGDSSTPPSTGFRFFLRDSLSRAGTRAQWLSYTVLLEPLGTEHLFLVPSAAEIRGRFRMLEVDANDSVLLRDRNFSAMRYDVLTNLAVPEPALLRSAPAIYPERIGELPRSTYLRLPPLDSRIAELSQRVSAAATNQYDRARMIEEHLRTQYAYSLDMPFTGDDPIAGFLFTQKRGHCEYFASAMTVMLRTLEIPSRLVNGFLPGEYNDISSLYVVRGSDAHSWVEAYFPSYGWIAFDPTPATGTLSLGGASRLRLYLDALQSFWIDWVIHYDFTRQLMLGRGLNRGTRKFSDDTSDYFRTRYKELALKVWAVHQGLKGNPATLPLLIAAVCGSLLLVMSSGRLAGFLRRTSSEVRSRSGRATARDATLAYQRLLHLLARRGYSRPPAMSAREFAPTVKDPALAPLVSEFTTTYEQARFGGAAELVPHLYGLLALARRTPRNHLK